MRKRLGIVVYDGEPRMIYAVVTGEMSDGTKVWEECDEFKNIINSNKQYSLQIVNKKNVFLPL